MTGKLYIPITKTIGDAPVPDPIPAPEPPIEPQMPVSCSMSIQEQAIFDLLAGHPQQMRKNIKCDIRLVRAARAKATDMANRHYLAHTDPSGETANALVQRHGYPLPYGDGNNVESIAAGYATAATAFDGWLQSPPHRSHLLAETDFWRGQTFVGIGYAHIPDSPYQRYWCLLTAP